MTEKLINLDNLNTFKLNLVESTDGSINVKNENESKIDLSIKISEEEGNAIEVKDDGIYSGSADGLVECDPVPFPVYRERKIYKTPYGEYKLYTGKGETYYESWELGDVRYANGTTFPNTTLAEEIARWRNEVVGSYIKATSGGDGKVLLKIETVADTGQLYYGTTNIGILVQGGPNVIYNGAGDIYSNVVFGHKKMAAVYAKEVQLATKDDLMDIDIDTSSLVKKENLTDKSITSLKVKLDDGGDVTIANDGIATNTPSDFIIGGQNTDIYVKANTVNLESNEGNINIKTDNYNSLINLEVNRDNHAHSTFVQIEDGYINMVSRKGTNEQGKIWIDSDGWVCAKANEQMSMTVVQNDTTNVQKEVFRATYNDDNDGVYQHTYLNAINNLNLTASSINLTGAVKVNGAPLQVGTWQEVHSGIISGGRQYRFDVSSKVDLYSQMCIFITDDDSGDPFIYVMETYDLQILRNYLRLVDLSDGNYGNIPLFQRYTLSNGRLLNYGYYLLPAYGDETLGKMVVATFGSSSYDTSTGKDVQFEFGEQWIKVFMR